MIASTPAGPRELLECYADLLAFAEQSALLGAREVSALNARAASARAAKVLVRARELREALAAVVYDLVNEKLTTLRSAPTPGAAFQGGAGASGAGVDACRRFPRICFGSFLAVGSVRDAPGASTLGCCEVCNGFVDIAGCQARAHVQERHLSVGLSGHQQESLTPLVRHENLRQSDESAAIPVPPVSSPDRHSSSRSGG